MATFLIIGTSGTDDPTRASLPFVQGNGVIEAGHQAQIVLLGEATHLIKGNMMDAVQGVGFAPLKELMSKLVESGATFHL